MNLRGELEIPLLTNQIIEALKEAAIKREPIHTDRYLRGVGKTTALIDFAIQYDFYVVVPHFAQQYIDRTGYEKIISASDLYKFRCDEKLVFDEGVKTSRLAGYQVITGFINEY